MKWFLFMDLINASFALQALEADHPTTTSRVPSDLDADLPFALTPDEDDFGDAFFGFHLDESLIDATQRDMSHAAGNIPEPPAETTTQVHEDAGHPFFPTELHDPLVDDTMASFTHSEPPSSSTMHGSHTYLKLDGEDEPFQQSLFSSVANWVGLMRTQTNSKEDPAKQAAEELYKAALSNALTATEEGRIAKLQEKFEERVAKLEKDLDGMVLPSSGISAPAPLPPPPPPTRNDSLDLAVQSLMLKNADVTRTAGMSSPAMVSTKQFYDNALAKAIERFKDEDPRVVERAIEEIGKMRAQELADQVTLAAKNSYDAFTAQARAIANSAKSEEDRAKALFDFVNKESKQYVTTLEVAELKHKSFLLFDALNEKPKITKTEYFRRAGDVWNIVSQQYDVITREDFKKFAWMLDMMFPIERDQMSLEEYQQIIFNNGQGAEEGTLSLYIFDFIFHLNYN